MSVADPIMSLSATALAKKIATGELSSKEVVEAFIRRNEEVHPQINGLIVQRFDAARQEAEQADEQVKQGTEIGPLHGVPVTIKETFDVAGTPTTFGLNQLAHRKAKSDAITVARLRRAGAVVLGKTNVPQLGLFAESDNPVYGRTNNPWDLERGAGGSTGGEAAVISAGGSPLGLGSDAAGSVRFPAHVCGICGLKPTGGRLSMKGHWLSVNWPADWAQPGPMALHVEDLTLGLKVLIDDRRPEVDETASPFIDPAEVELSNLRVGYYEQVDALPALPALKRGVVEARQRLQELGVDVVPIQPFEAEKIWKLFTQVFYAEGLGDLRKFLKGSQVDWRTKNMMRLARIPRGVRPPISAVAKVIGEKTMGETMANLRKPVISSSVYCRLLAEVQRLRFRFQAWMREQSLNAILAPPAPIPAFPHGDFYANSALMYNGIYNLLGVPAGVAHVTRVQMAEQGSYQPGRDVFDRSRARSDHGSEGLPIGVQVISSRWQDHVVLALLQQLHQPTHAPNC